MLMAIGSDGSLYCSLTQVNTDHRVFCVFISKLVAKLNERDKNWKERTIVVLDGASYGTCKESIYHMMMLGLKICVSAPYSYSAAPIELAFAYFKTGQLNPLGLKTGKR